MCKNSSPTWCWEAIKFEPSNFIQTGMPKNMTCHKALISCKLLSELGHNMLCCSLLKLKSKQWVPPVTLSYVNGLYAHEPSAVDLHGTIFARTVCVRVVGSAHISEAGS
ncbi:hypothetical protein KIL84_019238 [Mauremys mutica]|uniref:Uncharacterized protein n=1 Tax=Mauremys mutica TaxID=74926 RepID=A0A9D3XRX9_9SAUR|nr:hypothetical protein KIL84_019238 [Mauremys mutica]